MRNKVFMFLVAPGELWIAFIAWIMGVGFTRAIKDDEKTHEARSIEVLARAWIECDPNRGPSDLGSGTHPDDIMHEAHGELKGKPRWHWFVPRATATLDFLEKHGLTVRPIV